MEDYKQSIWAWLKGNTELTNVAIAGIMGNLECESNCEPVRKQSDFSAERTASHSYTDAVDRGEISPESFAKDSVGYGLAQWTYWTRKQNLLSYAKSKGTSVGDLTTQLEFMIAEMQSDYKTMWNQLMYSTDLSRATNLVLIHYERPAVLNLSDRLNAAQKILNEYKDTEPIAEQTPTTQTTYVVKIPKGITKIMLEIDQ